MIRFRVAGNADLVMAGYDFDIRTVPRTGTACQAIPAWVMDRWILIQKLRSSIIKLRNPWVEWESGPKVYMVVQYVYSNSDSETLPSLSPPVTEIFLTKIQVEILQKILSRSRLGSRTGRALEKYERGESI